MALGAEAFPPGFFQGAPRKEVHVAVADESDVTGLARARGEVVGEAAGAKADRGFVFLGRRETEQPESAGDDDEDRRSGGKRPRQRGRQGCFSGVGNGRGDESGLESEGEAVGRLACASRRASEQEPAIGQRGDECGGRRQ